VGEGQTEETAARKIKAVQQFAQCNLRSAEKLSS
jgi:hypothetical protein